MTTMQSTQADDAILVRMSRTQKAELRERAQKAGLTVRAYTLQQLFNLDAEELPSGRPGRVPRQQEALPLTG